MKKSTIYVSLDAGFSANKIIVNEHIYNIPFAIQDITNETERYNLRRPDNKYVRCEKNGHTYLIGEVAKEYILNSDRSEANKTTMEAFSTMARYSDPLFEIALQAFIAYGLQRYSLDSRKTAHPFFASEIDSYKVIVGVALPHKHIDELTPLLNKYLDRGIDISIMIGNDAAVPYQFKINGQCFNSQVISMFTNEAVTDELEDVEGEDDIYSMLPALMIDAGYKTVGKFLLAADQSVVGDDSDTTHAMLNVNEKVVAEINRYRPGFSEYQIDELYAKHEIIRYIDKETGKPGGLDVCEIRDRYLKETCEELIDDLCNEFNNLLDIKCILIGGGTGGLYYKYIKEYCDAERPYLSDHIILAGSKKFFGSECGPVNAIAAGLYKEILYTFGEE